MHVLWHFLTSLFKDRSLKIARASRVSGELCSRSMAYDGTRLYNKAYLLYYTLQQYSTRRKVSACCEVCVTFISKHPMKLC